MAEYVEWYNRDIPGFMVEYELRILAQWAMSFPKNSTFLELGSFLGRSSWVWATHSPQSTKLHFADSWKWRGTRQSYDLIIPSPGFDYRDGESIDIMETFLSNMPKDREYSLHQGRIPEQIEWTGDPIDVLFIDDDHSYDQLMSDFEHFQPHLSERSLICGHDYNPEHFPGVVRGVREIAKALNREIVTIGYTTLWYLKPKGWKVYHYYPNNALHCRRYNLLKRLNFYQRYVRDPEIRRNWNFHRTSAKDL